MMSVTVKELLADREKLGITKIAGQADSSRPVRHIIRYPHETGLCHRPMHDHAILIFSPGAAGRGLCGRWDGHPFPAAFPKVSCIALTGRGMPASFQDYSERTGTPGFASDLDEWLLKSRLTGLLREIGRRQVMVHGSLILLAGRGVLLTGESGIGKTAAALAAMHSDNRWVADDAVVLQARGDLLYGRGHIRTRDWIAVRGRGILRSTELLGADRLRGEARVDQVVRLIRSPGSEKSAGAHSCRSYAGISIPCRELVADAAPRQMADRLMDCVGAVQAGHPGGGDTGGREKRVHVSGGEPVRPGEGT